MGKKDPFEPQPQSLEIDPNKKGRYVIMDMVTGRRWVSVGYTLNEAIDQLDLQPNQVNAVQSGRNRKYQQIYEIGSGTDPEQLKGRNDYDQED